MDWVEGDTSCDEVLLQAPRDPKESSGAGKVL